MDSNIIVRPAREQDYPDILRLNDADVEMLSPMNEEIIGRMAGITDLFMVVEVDGHVAAFVMAYREGTEYWSDNYAWFCWNYEKFLYVDRIVVDRNYRKYGLGKRLYEEVFHHAAENDVPVITAEIDIAPKYNAASIAFHEKMGFHEVGTKISKETLTVSLQVKELCRMELKVIDYDLTVCKVVNLSAINLSADFFFIGKTDLEFCQNYPESLRSTE